LDQNTFIAWSRELATSGFGKFYEGWSDYLPGYLYILWFLGRLRSIFPIPEVFLYKLPAIISDVVAGYLIYKILKEFKGEKWGLIASGLYLFNPAVLANSTLWGQVDSLTILFSLLSISLLTTHPYLSAMALSAGTLIKPQAAFAAPVILLMMLKNKWQPGKSIVYIAFSFIVFVLGFLPFSSGNLPVFILERIGTTAGQYPYTSINAFNFWGLFGFWKPDGIFSAVVGPAVAVAVFLLTSYKLFKKKNFEYFLLTIVFSATFLFLTRMHERHLLPVFAPLAIVSAVNPEVWLVYVGFSFTYLANLYYAFNWVTFDFMKVFPDGVITALILLNLALFFLLLYTFLYRETAKRARLTLSRLIEALKGRPVKKPAFPKVELSPKLAKTLLTFVLVFAFIARVFDLGKPPNEYFDEVYHAFTARQILHSNPKAWEWWNTPPEGFAYEWTHPPLAKEAMVLGMLIFGENSFGWRIPSAILGVGIVFLVYLITKEIFADELIGILSAAFYGFDGLSLVLSRIGMNDTYFLFFALLSIYLFLKNSPRKEGIKNFLSALFLGLSLSSKWSAIWAIPILGFIWLWKKRDFKFSYLWFLIVPPLVYLATYIPMFLSGHGLDIFWGMQKQMWWYHTRLKATHPYTSLWWSWPVDGRSVYLYTSDETSGWVARIYAFGNPLVFWFGLLSVILTFTYALAERSKKAAFIVFSYLIFFIPWAASPRIMFLYHYLPSIPFLSIAAGYVLRRNVKLAILLIPSTLLFFLYFYPHWAGLSIPLWLDKSYYWFSSWR
jgi:predicted membrane-bound dolichyl-phosphate-mannose-protein mannosyltransferase